MWEDFAWDDGGYSATASWVRQRGNLLVLLQLVF